MNHDQIRHLRSLRLLLSQDKSPLGFLLAAGCPLSVRITGASLLPDMAGLTKIINDAHATDTPTTPYKRLIEELKKADRDTSNLEDILTYIRSMKEVSTGGGTVRGFTESELNNLETEICNTIADAVTKDLPDGDNSYRRLARWVSSIDRVVPVEIFTTNYDLLLEQALEEQNVPFFDGFSGSRYPFFDIHSVEENELPNYWARVWKLHGSVNWKTMSGRVYRVSKGIAGSPELIYPSKLKYDQSRKMPFLAMSDRLTSFLLKPHAVLFVCGYSFGDEHINDTINRGFVFIPEEGDQVLVGFELNNPSRPFVSGSLFHRQNGEGGKVNNNIKSIITRSGHTIIFDDSENGESITIRDKNSNKIILDTVNKTICIEAQEKIQLTSKVISFDAAELITSTSTNIESRASETILNAAKDLSAIIDNKTKIVSKELDSTSDKVNVRSVKEDLVLISKKQVITQSGTKKIKLS